MILRKLQQPTFYRNDIADLLAKVMRISSKLNSLVKVLTFGLVRVSSFEDVNSSSPRKRNVFCKILRLRNIFAKYFAIYGIINQIAVLT